MPYNKLYPFSPSTELICQTRSTKSTALDIQNQVSFLQFRIMSSHLFFLATRLEIVMRMFTHMVFDPISL